MIFIKETIRFVHYNKNGDIPLRYVPKLERRVHMSFLVLVTLITITIASARHFVNLKEALGNNEQ